MSESDLCFYNDLRIGCAAYHVNRSNQKRPRSSSRHSSSSLEPVAEENPLQYPDPNFKLSRLSEKGSTPDPGKLISILLSYCNAIAVGNCFLIKLG